MHCPENLKQIVPEMQLRGLVPSFYIHVNVGHLYIPTIGPQTQYTLQRQNSRNLETNIPRKGISGPQSQFPHSRICERFIYSHDRSPYSAGGNM
jgi:hypothetical protein